MKQRFRPREGNQDSSAGTCDARIVMRKHLPEAPHKALAALLLPPSKDMRARILAGKV
jgi:hypothetical protein